MAETGGDGSLDLKVEWAGAAGADRHERAGDAARHQARGSKVSVGPKLSLVERVTGTHSRVPIRANSRGRRGGSVP